MEQRYSALFVDFENVYYFLKRNTETPQDNSDLVSRMIRNLKDQLVKEYGENCIISHAYADFERIEENAQGALYLIGVETHNVLSTDHKNAADMRLCIDALETMYTRPEIQSFIFVAGDRDYIPVVKHLQKHAKTVRVVAFPINVSGDLLQIVGEAALVNAEKLLPKDVKIEPKKADVARRTVAEPDDSPSMPAVTYGARNFKRPSALRSDDALEAIRIMLEHFGDKREIWVSPFLHKMRNEMPLLAEYERKAIISDLEDHGAIVVEKRRGEPNDYSVIIVNWDHPNVRDLMPEFEEVGA